MTPIRGCLRSRAAAAALALVFAGLSLTGSACHSSTSPTPAATVDVTGTWSVTGSRGEVGTFVLTQSGNTVTGTERDINSTIAGTVSGNTLTFLLTELKSSSCSDSFNFSVTVQGSTMTGTSVFTAYNCGSVPAPVPLGTTSTITGTKQ